MESERRWSTCQAATSRAALASSRSASCELQAGGRTPPVALQALLLPHKRDGEGNGRRGGTNGQVATTAVPLRGQCLSDYIHSDSKPPECRNLLSCHVSVPSLFLCHLGNLKALVQPGIAQLFALSQSEVRSVHPLATALVAACRLISILPADLTIKL